MRAARLLNSSAEVWRETRIPDGMGGGEATWTQVGTARARFSQPSATERVVAAANGADLFTPVYLRSDADVLRGDQLRRGPDVFEVRAVFQPSEPNTYLRADCRQRQAQP
ncbi:head-tail adaptor protein [Streptomyces europaeiscabiei]|uniref:Head-tail adaptor protein n=1 Tax=Streptomyces europaeiscabiei TaxID=146819 RepID=A0ABU4N6S0_9ACTN|nr:head-tail adaptor protein [Streptomyces europaeiscabiei]MDX3550980.1 head-tail adaptor protein [Streptomyces europaeiscabiei]MDX3698460.1 head-tail adaptor protein [Streptomyces europaeiscabiei]